MKDDKEEIPRRELPPEQRIWRAVIANAFNDLTGVPTTDNPRKRAQLRASALEWLTTNNEGLQLCCGFAGLDPKQVVRAARATATYRSSATSEPPAGRAAVPPTQ